jgi:ribosomal protein L11 methylase PrmA
VGLLSGAARAVGIDCDRGAIENARQNATLNGLAERTTFRTRAASTLQGKFDLVVSNIGLTTLLELRRELAPLAPLLVLTGILENEVDRLGSAYGRSGFAVVRTERRDGWAVLTLARGRGRAARWAAPGKVARTRRARGP